MRILYCNVQLTGRSGTEVVTIETARMLRALGHDVCVLTGIIGSSGRVLTDEGFPVTTALGEVPWTPDVIHSNHLPQSIEAAVRFPSVPQIFICHDPTAWHSKPPALSVIRRWLAVDEICAERIATTITPSPPVLRLRNAVDLGAFPRRPPLPAKPRRALALVKHRLHVATVEAACRQAGLQFDAIGPGAGNEVDDLPQRLPDYDLVFTTARMALEALAAGCSVVVADERGLAGIVTSANVAQWRADNLGARLLTRSVTAEALGQEIARYDSDDAGRVTDFIRSDAALTDYASRLIEIYDTAIADARSVLVNPALTMREAFDEAVAFIDAALAERQGTAAHEGSAPSLYRLRMRIEAQPSQQQLVPPPPPPPPPTPTTRQLLKMLVRKFTGALRRKAPPR